MKLEEVESLVRQLEPRDQLKLAAGICEQLSQPQILEESADVRRERLLRAIAMCDEIAGPDGDQDSVNDLQQIRDSRMADIG